MRKKTAERRTALVSTKKTGTASSQESFRAEIVAKVTITEAMNTPATTALVEGSKPAHKVPFVCRPAFVGR